MLARALAESLGTLLPDRIEVKPPNDLLVDGRKLAGVLIEQSVGAAVIGIGINVHINVDDSAQMLVLDGQCRCSSLGST